VALDIPEWNYYVYWRNTPHSGYPGGISSTNFDKMQDRFPGRALEKAVKGMLPKGPLGYAMIKKLKVYGDASHPHAAQQPFVKKHQKLDFGQFSCVAPYILCRITILVVSLI